MAIEIKDLLEPRYLETVFADFDGKIDPSFVKSLREKLGLTQYVFAKMLHVSKKTVEKWEQGGNPIKGGDAALLYLLNKHPEYAKDLLMIIPHNMAAPSKFAFLVDYSKVMSFTTKQDYYEHNANAFLDDKSYSWGVITYYA